MERKWTDAQKKAIETTNKTLLVSAAAGSGKTAALTERIIRSLTDTTSAMDIDRMLIVTFTRAAASELRARIFSAVSNALEKDPSNKHLCEQLIKLSSAKICTIDSFYLDIIRSSFDKLDISPSFRTADTAELEVLSMSVMEDTVDYFYEMRSDEFESVAECFVGIRNTANLSPILLDLYSQTESLPEGIDFLLKSAEQWKNDASLDLFESSCGPLFKKEVLKRLRYYRDVYLEMCDWISKEEKVRKAYLTAFLDDKAFIEKAIELIDSNDIHYSAAREHIFSYNAKRLGSLRGYYDETLESYKEIRSKFKEYIAQLKERTFAVSADELPSMFLRTSEICSVLYDLLSDFEAKLTEEKKKRNILSFTDIRHYAMKLLVDENGKPTETAKLYADRFDQIYIDEYQDVDRVQDEIFKSISTPHSRFMVGDIKQSIYGFRGAEPEVFSSYRQSFTDVSSEDAAQKDEASVFMSNNFRCDSTVIDFTNDVCSFIFSACKDSIGYTSADDLIFSKIVENRVYPETPVELAILTPHEDDVTDSEDEEVLEESNKELEAKYIAERIKKLLKDGYKADGSKIEKHDIAVLFRTKTMGAYVSRALANAGIDCADSTDDRYFESPDVLLMLCLLNAIDNPQRDIYLAGLLRSPLFGFTLDDLVRIRYSDRSFSASLYDTLCEFSKGEGELCSRCKDFLKTLNDFRELSAGETVDKLIKHLYSSDLLSASGLVNYDESNNLIRLYEYARSFEGSSFKGLSGFIKYVYKLIEMNTRLENGSSETDEGKVKLMTIHQSKGLEFPVCILAGASGLFNMQSSRESLVFEPSGGVAMKIADDTGYARIATPMRDVLISLNKNKQIEEEMRVLYVALTRARERLIITANINTTPEKTFAHALHNRTFKGEHTIGSARSYLDWILSAFDVNCLPSYFKITIAEKTKIGDDNNDAEEEMIPNSSDETDENTQELRKLLSNRFAFEYPYKAASELPAKISVSRLLPLSPDEENELSIEDELEEYTDTRNFKEYNAPAILEYDEHKRAEANKYVSAAKRGTATHLFLQFCDYKNCEENGVEEELARLIDKGFVPCDTKKLVFKDELIKFFDSELYSLIKNAKKLYRERRFNILLPTSTLSGDEEFLRQTEGDMLAVQGVIDLIIEDENGDLILCDYKTDRMSRDELSDADAMTSKLTERHSKQLSYYKEAVKRLFGKECKKALIYSTHAAKTFEITTYSIECSQ